MRVSPDFVAATAIDPPGSVTFEAFAACVGASGTEAGGAGGIAVAASRVGTAMAAVCCGRREGDGFGADLAGTVGALCRTAAAGVGASGTVVGATSVGAAVASTAAGAAVSVLEGGGAWATVPGVSRPLQPERIHPLQTVAARTNRLILMLTPFEP